MIDERTATLADLVLATARRLGRKEPGVITEAIIRVRYPNAVSGCELDGAVGYLSRGLQDAVKDILKKVDPAPRQHDFAERHPQFAKLKAELRSCRYFVPSRDEYVDVDDLIDDLPLFEQAEALTRKKGVETIDEADRMRKLINEVKRQSKPALI